MDQTDDCRDQLEAGMMPLIQHPSLGTDYAHEEIAVSMFISAILGAMNLLVEDGEVEHADGIAEEMVLQVRGAPVKAKRIAGLPLPGEGG